MEKMKNIIFRKSKKMLGNPGIPTFRQEVLRPSRDVLQACHVHRVAARGDRVILGRWRGNGWRVNTLWKQWENMGNYTGWGPQDSQVAL
jgi:hypothetical protein